MAAKKSAGEVKKKPEEQEMTIKAAEEAVIKKFGVGAALFLSDVCLKKPEIIPTGSSGLDYATGVGGIPRGRMTEVFGPPASGKSTLALSIAAMSHTCTDGDVLYVDAEKALDPSLVRALGLRDDRTVVIDRSTAEENLDVAQIFIKTGKFSVVIIDSVAALTPQAEFDANFDDQFMGIHPKLMSRMCRTIKPLCSKTNTALILINQTRDNLGQYGSPKQTTGGHAIRFFSDLRIEARGGHKSSLIAGPDGDIIGQTTTFTVVKNKLSRPWRSCSVDLIYGSGYDTIGELVTVGEELGFIKIAGAWFEYKGNKVQGKIKMRQLIIDNVELQQELRNDVKTLLG